MDYSTLEAEAKRLDEAVSRYTVSEEPELPEELKAIDDQCDRFESLNFDRIMSNLWVVSINIKTKIKQRSYDIT